MISGFFHKAAENCTLLGYYTTSSGNTLPTFWDNLSVPNSKGCPETSARNYHYLLHNTPEECSSLTNQQHSPETMQVVFFHFII
jgi:hypothetical protein